MEYTPQNVSINIPDFRSSTDSLSSSTSSSSYNSASTYTSNQPMVSKEKEMEMNLNINQERKNKYRSKWCTSKAGIAIGLFAFVCAFFTMTGFIFVSILTESGKQDMSYVRASMALGIPLVVLNLILTPTVAFACSLTVPTYFPNPLGAISISMYILFAIASVIWIFSLIFLFPFGQAAVIITGLLGFASTILYCMELLLLVTPTRAKEVKPDENVLKTIPSPSIHNSVPVSFGAK